MELKHTKTTRRHFPTRKSNDTNNRTHSRNTAIDNEERKRRPIIHTECGNLGTSAHMIHRFFSFCITKNWDFGMGGVYHTDLG